MKAGAKTMSVSGPERAEARRWAGVVLAFVLAIILGIAAGKSFVARMFLVPGDAAESALRDEIRVPRDYLALMMDSREKALAWRSLAKARDDLAMGSFMYAQNEGLAKEEAVRTLGEGMDWQVESLAAAPANTYGWARLAFLKVLTDSGSGEAARALEMSVITAPYEPRLMLSRLMLALELEKDLAPDLQRQIPSLIRQAWRLQPYPLAQAAKAGGFVPRVEDALRDDASAIETLRKMTAGIPARPTGPVTPPPR